MNFSKILNHPDLQHIITKLTSGEPARSVSEWLKERYPDDKDKQISYNTLNEFRTEQLNIHGAVLEDIQHQIQKTAENDVKDELVKEVKKNKTYREKLNEVVDQQIDWRYKLLQLMNIIETRIEQIFDRTQENPDNCKPDYVLIQWMEKLIQMIELVRKVEGAPDQVIQQTTTVQIVEEQSALLQEALRQTLAEIDLETSLLLMEKISDNLSKLKMAKETDLANERTFNKITSGIDQMHRQIVPALTINNDEGNNGANK